MRLADLCGEVGLHADVACGTQLGRAGFDDRTIHGGHACGGGALARGIGEDVQPRQIAVVHEL